MTLVTLRTPLWRRIVFPAIALLAACLACASRARANAVVTLCQTADDTGSGTNLRTALTATPDPNSQINTITFQCPGSPTIQVGSPLEIFQATKIDGGNNITLLGTNFKTLIVVANPGNFLYLYNLTLRNPNTDPTPCTAWLTSGCTGSVVAGQGVTELHHVQVDSSHIPIAVSSGTLLVDHSQFQGNGEAVIVAAPAATSTTVTQSIFSNNSGAPIEATGSVNITDSQLMNNGAADLENCQLNIDRTMFQGNTTNGALNVNCTATIAHSVFRSNTSTIFGGAILFDFGTSQITLRGDQFLNNSAGPGGGAVYWRPPVNMNRTLSVLYSTFKGNKAASGGAIDLDNSVDSSGTTIMNVGVTYFSQNATTGSGGAINAASTQLQIARAGFAKNTATGNGGGIFLSNASPLHSVIANAIFARNTAASGSAFYGDDAEFINSTVDSNSGLAIANQAPHSPVHIKLTNSIISNNSKGDCGPAGLFDDGGKNLQFPGGDCGASIKVANPELDPMWIPLANSPALGFGNVSVCTSPPINGRDVYGVGRPSAGLCTAGAAERQIETLTSGRKGPPGNCDCSPSLVQRLLQLLTFSQ